MIRPCALALLLASTLALAQPAADAELCRRPGIGAEATIRHCTAAIESGKVAGEALAMLYAIRSSEWATQGDLERALADAEAAVKIAPRLRVALQQRGSVWANRGEPDRAIADFSAALKIKPDDAVLLHARAVEHTVKGDYARARADFDAALRLAPNSNAVRFARGRMLFYAGDYARAVQDIEAAYQVAQNEYIGLWLYIARKRAGVADAEQALGSDMRGMIVGMTPVITALYTGRTVPEAVIAAARHPDPARQREALCEAKFYTAHWHLIREDRDSALPLLREVQRDCPRNILEYEGAVAELRRLK
jgi:lipoprotein NlpI